MESYDAIEIITHGTETIIDGESLVRYLSINRPIKIKFGVDPTRPDLTLGHMVVFNKLRQFQELGHQAILLIGDYTATIGDPSGRSATRPVLSAEEVEHNAETYLQQAFRILDHTKTTVRRNSEWFSKMSFDEALLLARKMTVARMLERDDFQKRHQSGIPISIVEFLYPLIQGYDSVMLDSDVEIGGSDQLFNMLVGRTLQKEIGMREQVVISMPLLVGLDGVRKMSKSYDNYIAFNDTPRDMFGKIMSISDETMWAYYRSLLDMGETELSGLKAVHPMEAKKQLASRLVAKFFGESQATKERSDFEAVFSNKKFPDDMPVFSWGQLAHDDVTEIVTLIHTTGLFPSKKELRRLYEQNAIRVMNARCPDGRLCRPKKGESLVIQIGKRHFFKV
ncbi:MAG: tyrosine--tRNA ligase, partial [Puniceicoccales bacterium]|nr:tyrosine--tRNA ligase [Puniceicoccales bacterium]